MTDLRTAAQQALEALARFVQYDYRGEPLDGKDLEGHEAITALRERLAQPVQEPVAWMLPGSDSIITAETKAYRGVLAENWTLPLYPAPPQRKPVVVSVDELANHIRVVDGNHSLGAGALAEKIVEFLIERAHGIKE